MSGINIPTLNPGEYKFLIAINQLQNTAAAQTNVPIEIMCFEPVQTVSDSAGSKSQHNEISSKFIYKIINPFSYPQMLTHSLCN